MAAILFSMFDIGSPELLIVAVVALLVLGPERLPQAIRSLVTWWARLSRSTNRIRKQIEEEIGFDQIRQQLHEEGVVEEIKAMKVELNKVTEGTSFGLDELTEQDQATVDPTHWPGMPPSESDSASDSRAVLPDPPAVAKEGNQ